MNNITKYSIIRKKVVLVQLLSALPGMIISYSILSYFFAIPFLWMNLSLGILAATIGLAHYDYRKMKSYLAKKNSINIS